MHAALDHWVIFADMLVGPDRLRLVDDMREKLWTEGKALGNAREHGSSRGRRNQPVVSYRPAAFVTLRRIKQISAELEFLEELRRGLEHAPQAAVTIASKRGARSDPSGGNAARSAPTFGRPPRRF